MIDTLKLLFLYFHAFTVLALAGAAYGYAYYPDVPVDVAQQKESAVTIYVNDKKGNLVASGSGFVVAPDGVIVSNCQVIAKWLEAENTLTVTATSGESFALDSLISSRCENGVALFTIDAKGLHGVRLASNYRPKKGEEVFIIGSPLGQSLILSQGVIADVGEKRSSVKLSFSLSPGIGGSPVFNAKGEVIGVAVVPSAKKGDVAYIIPSGYVEKVRSRYRMHQRLTGKVSRGRMGAPSADTSSDTTQVKSSTPEELYLLAASYSEQRMYKEAIELYKRALQRKPDYLDALIGEGVTYYSLGKYSEAVAAYKEALKIKPNSVLVYNKLGTAHLSLGEYPLAIDAFKSAIRIDPKNAGAHFDLGITYFLSGDEEAAEKEYTILKRLDAGLADRLFDMLY